jgi:LuxR family maltose regulon positive regulatory protein
MGNPLVRTAGCTQPPEYPFDVAETSVIKRLKSGAEHSKLTLISAPFGYGKTVAMAELFRDVSLSNACALWVGLTQSGTSLDELMALLRDVLVRFAELQGEQRADLDTVSLVSRLLSTSSRVILFLDNLEFCTDPALPEFVNQLVFESSPLLTVFATCSGHVAFDDARARVEGRLLTVEADDLRLGPDDVREMLGASLCKVLHAPEIELIIEKTEGWPLAVRLMQIALERSDSPFETVARYSGADKDVAALLRSHYLQPLSEEMQELLMSLALFPQIQLKLIQDVLGGSKVVKQIEWLCENNQFLSATDRNQTAFKLHRLVRDFLLQEGLKRLDEKHRRDMLERAAEWARNNGNWKEAVEYALEARAAGLASRLLDELAQTWVGQRGQFAEYIGWVQRLRLLGAQLSIEAEYWYLWSLLFTRQHRAAYVQSELLWNRLGTDEDLAKSPERQSDFRKRVEEIKIGINVFRDQLGIAGREAMEWFQREGNRNEISIATVACTLALNALSNFEFTTARHALRTATTAVNTASTSYGSAWVSVLSALIDVYEGQFSQCHSSLTSAMKKVSDELGDDAPIMATMSLVAAQCELEMGNADQARSHLKVGLRGCDVHGLNETTFCGIDTALRLWDGTAGAEYSPEALSRCVGSLPDPINQIFGCFAVQRLLKLGRVEDALHHCERAGIIIDRDMAELAIDPVHQTEYIRELVSVTQLEYLYATKNLRRASSLCASLLIKAEQYRRRARTVELEIMSALLAMHSESSHTAVRHLARAIRLAANRRIVFPFLDRKQELAGVVARTKPKEWAFAEEHELEIFSLIRSVEAPPDHVSHTEGEEDCLFGQLTSRELELLRFVSTGFSNQQIAERTCVSLATVKWHLYNLYAKLNVRSRSAAVAKARAMRLI